VAHIRVILQASPFPGGGYRRVWRVMRQHGLLAPTRQEGQVALYIAVDHCSAECGGIHAATPGTRCEALEPIRQGVRTVCGAFGQDMAQGLVLRYDHGRQYRSHVYQEELRFLGIVSALAFVRAPQDNGCAERFIRTLKEHL
jgi:transposase InsO family protein